MNILEWVVWIIAAFVFIIHIFLFFNSDPGVSRLAKRFSLLIAIGLAITVFTKLSKFHLIWWLPLAYFINLVTFSAGVHRDAHKFIENLKKEKNKSI
jgi:hypothetical protein